jgi:hypothetical protein
MKYAVLRLLRIDDIRMMFHDARFRHSSRIKLLASTI